MAEKPATSNKPEYKCCQNLTTFKEISVNDGSHQYCNSYTDSGHRWYVKMGKNNFTI